MKEENVDYSYCKGFSALTDEVDETLEAQALAAAKTADKVVIMAGLPDIYESEGYDRVHMHLPPSQNRLIKRLSGVCSRLVVVLSNGSPVEMPWEPLAEGILEGYLEVRLPAVPCLIFCMAKESERASCRNISAAFRG